MLTSLLIATCLGAGLVGGVFFAFSAFVMKALAQLPAEQGIAAMQRINVVVLNPLFLGVFIGTTLLGLACMSVALFGAVGAPSVLIFAAGLIYVVGSFVVTLVFNVPRNERLTRLDAGSSEAAIYWSVYLREWCVWNHVRTVASAVASVLAAVALAC